MVSVWPTVDNRTESYREMRENGTAGTNGTWLADQYGFPRQYRLL